MGIRLVALTAALAACAPDFDSQRTTSDPGSFGERVVTLMCKRLAFQADPTDVSGDRYREACRGGPLPDNPAPTVAALHADRARVVVAVDAIFPKDTLDALQTYLTSAEILGLYDDDTMSKTIASLGDLLEDISTHTGAMEALARRGGRDGYRPPGQSVGPAAPLTASPHIRSLLQNTLPTLLPGGAAKAEWDALVTALAATFADASPVPVGAISTSAAIVDNFLLTESESLGDVDGEGKPKPLLAVRRDAQGYALFTGAGASTVPAPAPFATTGDTSPRDELGRAVDANNAPVYEYFDVGKTLLGGLSNDLVTLLDPQKSTVIDFLRGASRLLGDRVAATKTFESGATLAYTGYDTAKSSPLLDLAHAFTSVLRDPNIDDTLDLADTLLRDHQGAAAQLLESAVVSARYADEHPEAEITAPLWDELRPLLLQLLSNQQLVNDLLVAMEDPQTAKVIQRFAEQMKYKDVFQVGQNAPYPLSGAFSTVVDRTKPDTKAAAGAIENRSVFERILQFIHATNKHQLCNKQGAVVRFPREGIPILSALIGGLPVVTFNECQLFRVDNMAKLYLQSNVYAKQNGNIICEGESGSFGNITTAATPEGCFAQNRRPRRKADLDFQWDSGSLLGLPPLPIPLPATSAFLSLLGGDAYIESHTFAGMRSHPTPEGLNRVIFVQNQPELLNDAADPVKDKFGAIARTEHAGTLLNWECLTPRADVDKPCVGVNAFFDEVRPIMQAFADANQEQLFIDIMLVVYRHWASKQNNSSPHDNPNDPRFTPGSNGVSYEPLVIKVFEGPLWSALTGTAHELNLIRVGPHSKKYAEVLAGAGRFVFSPLPGLADRRGVTTSTTADGQPLTTLSPWHLIADAYRGKRARLAAMGPDGTLWPESASELVDVLARGVAPTPGDPASTWRFQNRNLVPVALGATALIRGRLAEYPAGAARTAWLAQTLPSKFQDLIAHPVFAGAVDLLDATGRAGQARTAIEQLLHSVHDAAASPEAFAIMRTTAADLIQLARDDADLVPLGKMAGALLAPDKPYLTTQLVFLDKLYRADTASTLTNLVARLFKQHDAASDPGIPALSAVSDGIGNVDRLAPGMTPVDWSTGDYSSVFREVSEFLKEEQRGLPRFITIVKERNL